jgi:hypothetical protein
LHKKDSKRTRKIKYLRASGFGDEKTSILRSLREKEYGVLGLVLEFFWKNVRKYEFRENEREKKERGRLKIG